MAELKNMTVQALRELARKALGRGHSRLKTKAELIQAIQAAEQKVAKAAGKAAMKIERAVASVRSKRRADKDRKRARPAAPAAPSPAAPPVARSTQREGSEPEPDAAGYMVARVAGEDALRAAPHAMTESAVESGRARGQRARGPEAPRGATFEEHLGDLPWAYADDSLIALPRDPQTLFLYWDHAPETLRQTWEGLDGGRPQIWVFEREPAGTWRRVRVVDFALESRSYYLHDLAPGGVYRAEIHVVDRRGRDKLLPRASNEMMLPPVGPSPVIDDRFMRILWSEPLQRLLRSAQPGGPFPDDIRAQFARLSDWSRFAGPVWGGSAGGMGGRPLSGAAAPTSPSSPGAPWSGSDREER